LEASTRSAVLVSPQKAELDAGVRELLKEQQFAIMRMLGRIILYGALPIVCLICIQTIRTGSYSFWYGLELLSLSVAALTSLHEGLAFEFRRKALTAALTVVGISGLLHFGPFIGSGFLLVAALLASAVLVTEKRALLVAVVMVLALGAEAVLALAGVSTFAMNPELQLGRDQWLRTFLTSSLGIFGVLAIFQQLQKSLWRSLKKEMAGRLRESRLMAERERVLRGAAAAQRLESLGRLAGGVAHDFNNALVVIQCGIEALEDELSESERREILDELAQGVDRAAGTARQLLAFAKRNVEDIGETEPRSALERLERSATRLLPPHVTLRMEVNDDVPMVAMSEAAFEQVLLNLLNNAMDALHAEGGNILVSARADLDSGGLVVTVEDDGPGIPDDVVEHVFEPFFTTKGDLATGLGLATVWGVVHRMGGEVSLHTSVGRGSKVVLSFPASVHKEQHAPPVEPSAPSVARPTRSHRRVLVLEDEPPVRSAYRRILKVMNLEVVEASSVAEARGFSKQDDFALLISDGIVPDGGVGAFISEFRARHDGAPVILCSGYLEEELALDGLAQRQCVFLPKPFSASDLTALVSKLLRESDPAQSASGSS
jgi:signal transduction histidine kinase/CheY-like chemotaxis protein